MAVNKLETVDWSQNRFNEIRTNLRQFLKTVGFREADVIYVPCSGLTGENLVNPGESDKLTSWYNGPTLLHAIGKLYFLLLSDSCQILTNIIDNSTFKSLLNISYLILRPLESTGASHIKASSHVYWRRLQGTGFEYSFGRQIGNRVHANRGSFDARPTE